MQRIRQDMRGVSNVIVFVLGLIIVTMIVANVFLWNYGMNQLDWEKMNEDIKIIDVATRSWFVAQSEYTVNMGSRISGTYIDTQAVDYQYERFTESSSGSLVNTTLIDAESFEGTWPPTGWTETDAWNKESDQAYDGTYSADFDGSLFESSGDLNTPDLDCSAANAIYVDFWYRDDNLDANDFLLKYYDGSSWDTISDLGSTTQENQWLHYQQKITDSRYFVSTFKVRWSGVSVGYGEHIYVDLVTVEKEVAVVDNRLDIDGTFVIDVSTHPLAYIQTVEIQLKYRGNETSENWYLKAYNWTATAYSDSGFNSTIGHTPTTGWDYYAVNLTDQWGSYVHDNGIMYVKVVDEGADSAQTTIDVDFLAVRVVINGTMFIFQNKGPLTSHLVSLWVNNSTHHQRYDINLFINSGETISYIRNDISLPYKPYTVKVVTERENIATYSES